MKVSRWVVPVFTLFCAGLVLASTALAEGRLDRAFGENGVVDLTADIAKNRSLGTMAVAPDGSVFFTERAYRACPRSGCLESVYLKRYRANGVLDGRFSGGRGRRPVADSAVSGVLLAVDSANRPLVAWNKISGDVVIRRFRRDGAPDRSFGGSGTVLVPCGCHPSSLAVAPGGRLLIAGSAEFERTERGAIWVFARLRPSGAPDRGFGGTGVVRLPMSGYYDAVASAGPRGSSLLTGFHCCHGLPFVSRLSESGHLDRLYTATTARSLRAVHRTNDIGWEEMTLVPRPHGKVDLYGSGFFRGVAIRLLHSGRRDRSFGQNGISRLPLRMSDVASDGSGGAFVAGYARAGYRVLRLRPNGSADRRFGRLLLPNAYNEEGVEIVAQGRGSAIVFDRGESVCRQTCPSHPKMFRVLR